MNKTRIEWTDYTWNPVAGCNHGCSYCYARPIAEKIYGGFNPKFWADRLGEPQKVRKPSKIFVSSMGDLFGDWVPTEWINQILRCVLGSRHTFQFLTKNPKRLTEFNPWPDNCWVGTTVTNQADADERIPWLLKVVAPVRFVSHEPLLSAIDMEIEWGQGVGDLAVDTGLGCSHIDWAIIGAMTGPGAVKPEPDWVVSLEEQYQAAGVPIFEKENLYPYPLKYPVYKREWPNS